MRAAMAKQGAHLPVQVRSITLGFVNHWLPCLCDYQTLTLVFHCASQDGDDKAANELEACFKLFANEQGFVSATEIEKVMTSLGEEMTTVEIGEMIAEVTTEKFLDFDNFKKLMAVRPK
jgi:hypothetical protein